MRVYYVKKRLADFSLVLCLLILLFAQTSRGYVHNRPTPTLPILISPSDVTDVFSISAIIQVHRTLFRIDENNTPVPDLVKEFDVSADQKTYRFVLLALKFHDGTALNFTAVQRSLESTLKKRSPGYEKLSTVFGFEPFLKGKIKHLTGLVPGTTSQEFFIKVFEPSPNLISILSDFRFSILPPNLDPKIGLGPYRYESFGPNQVSLVAVPPASAENPNRVVYSRTNKDEAIKGFEKSFYDDLFMFPIKPAEGERFQTVGKVDGVVSPRTYLLGINPRPIPDRKNREAIIEKFSAEEIVKNCYPGNQKTDSVIPPGFMGYLANLPKSKRSNSRSYGKSLRIGIAKGVDEEACVRNQFIQTLNDHQPKIEFVDIDPLLEKWRIGTVDVIFFYLESESILDLFQFFNPRATFSFGDPLDTSYEKLLEIYSRENNPALKNEKAVALSMRILDAKTVFPLFHPLQYLIYNKRYQRMRVGISSPTFVRFKEFRRENLNDL